MPILVQLIAQKHTLGAAQVGGEFTYEVRDSTDDVVATTTNNADGTIVFPDIAIDEAGDYDFTIVETTTGGNWANNLPTTYSVNVLVLEAGGVLTPSISYPDGFPLFVNTYTTPTKGLVEFDEIEYTEPGVYYYTIKELSASGQGWTTDSNTFQVVVTITDDGEGNLIPSVEYPDGFPEFTNSYAPGSTSIVLTATKLAIGAALPAGKFKFGLFDDQDTLIETVTNGQASETLPIV